MAKIVCVLYDDPVDGYPKAYARDEVAQPKRYPDGQTLPSPKAIDFKPGTLLGSVSGELGLRKFLESNDHQLMVTSSKDGADSVLDQELPDADIVISQPFWPAYMTRERIAKASKLRLIVTAGIGSDHIDLQAAIDRNITVAEVTYCNSISVSEHVVMMILALVRNYIPSYEWVVTGERELNVTYHPSVESMVEVCDVVTINCPLHPETEHLFNDALIAKMKRGSYIVNTARGKICDRDAIVRALESGQLAGYAGDVWFPQPAPVDHPWRSMPHHGMTPHISGTSLTAQTLECWFENRPIRDEYLIVSAGKLAGAGAHSYSAGDATSGSEEAVRFKKG
jgi:formate dehydrogenase